MGKHEALARRIRVLRQARSWTQQDLSIKSGLTRSYISRLEMGDIALPASDKLRSLSSALGTLPDDLLQAAGFLDEPSQTVELPEIKLYLRRKYHISDPRVLQAVETIVTSMQTVSEDGDAELDVEDVEKELRLAPESQGEPVHH
jgi:transcriptional regulator with XRE-family HTH domain